MKIEIVKNKKGEILKTKDNIELKNYYFEVGDEFIPKYNSINTKVKKVNFNGKIITINEYKLVCYVKDKDKNIITNNGVNEIFVTLTPAQFNTINKKLVNGVEINQNLFIVYEYEIVDKDTSNKSKYIGVGIKTETKKSKTFEDFDEISTDTEEN